MAIEQDHPPTALVDPRHGLPEPLLGEPVRQTDAGAYLSQEAALAVAIGDRRRAHHVGATVTTALHREGHARGRQHQRARLQVHAHVDDGHRDRETLRDAARDARFAGSIGADERDGRHPPTPLSMRRARED